MRHLGDFLGCDGLVAVKNDGSKGWGNNMCDQARKVDKRLIRTVSCHEEHLKGLSGENDTIRCVSWNDHCARGMKVGGSEPDLCRGEG